jgi:hypothetical protein
MRPIASPAIVAVKFRNGASSLGTWLPALLPVGARSRSPDNSDPSCAPQDCGHVVPQLHRLRRGHAGGTRVAHEMVGGQEPQPPIGAPEHILTRMAEPPRWQHRLRDLGRQPQGGRDALRAPRMVRQRGDPDSASHRPADRASYRQGYTLSCQSPVRVLDRTRC